MSVPIIIIIILLMIIIFMFIDGDVNSITVFFDSMGEPAVNITFNVTFIPILSIMFCVSVSVYSVLL